MLFQTYMKHYWHTFYILRRQRKIIVICIWVPAVVFIVVYSLISNGQLFALTSDPYILTIDTRIPKRGPNLHCDKGSIEQTKFSIVIRTTNFSTRSSHFSDQLLTSLWWRLVYPPAGSASPQWDRISNWLVSLSFVNTHSFTHLLCFYFCAMYSDAITLELCFAFYTYILMPHI